MILDLIVIVLVIILSYLFSNVTDKKQNCFASNIIVGFSGIIFYNLARYFKLKETLNTNNLSFLTNKEKFTVDSKISDFINSKTDRLVTPQNLNNEKLDIYTNKIGELTAEIKKLNNNAQQSNENTSPQDLKDISSISLENQQAYQQFQIDFLSKQIKNAQDIINAETMSKNAIKYKPIKLFSSCVANADGSLTRENPVKDEFNGMPDKDVVNSNATRQIMNTISQSNPNDTPIQNNNQNLLQSLLSKLVV